MSWIKVEDEMPKEHEEKITIPGRIPGEVSVRKYKTSGLVNVIVVNDSDERFTYSDITVDGKWSHFSGNHEKVTHWCPIPDLPEE